MYYTLHGVKLGFSYVFLSLRYKHNATQLIEGEFEAVVPLYRLSAHCKRLHYDTYSTENIKHKTQNETDNEKLIANLLPSHRIGYIVTK